MRSKLGTERLDRHKIGAAIAGAILHCLPLVSSVNPKPPPRRTLNQWYPNELFALNAALSIVRSFILHDKNISGTRRQIFLKGFLYPNAHGGDYVTHLLKAFYWARIDDKFNCFLVANLLFCIENHTELEGRRLLGINPQQEPNG